MEEKVAIQGIKGSFHHQVAQEYFGEEVAVQECRSFSQVIKSLKNGKANKAVMAIENSIAGSILPNFALIDEHEVQITGEHYIPIFMNLMALPGQKIKDITEVYSHPIALLQCKDFFEKHSKIRLIEDTDTAGAARRVQKQNQLGIAAVAGNIAAKMYNLEIISEGIHSVKNNATRFLILGSKNAHSEENSVDKASLKFELDNRHGSLASVLNILNDCQLNLTKIQSLPIIETPWKYSFFVDVTFEKFSDYQKALQVLEVMTTHLKILGEYKNGRK